LAIEKIPSPGYAGHADQNPNIHARKSRRLRFPLSIQPEKIRCSIVKGEKNRAKAKTEPLNFQKPAAFLQRRRLTLIKLKKAS
jgi:hypothetical protein